MERVVMGREEEEEEGEGQWRFFLQGQRHVRVFLFSLGIYLLTTGNDLLNPSYDVQRDMLIITLLSHSEFPKKP